MIVLLGYSTNLFADNLMSENVHHIPSIGGVASVTDSVLIAYDDLRIVNSKLIQLEYEQAINSKLRTVISNDSIIIRNYKVLNDRINKDCKKAILQRNIAIGTAAIFFLTSIFLLIK